MVIESKWERNKRVKKQKRSNVIVLSIAIVLVLVLGKIMPAAVDGYEHAVAHTSYSLLWSKGYDAAVELADIVETACGSIHPAIFL